MKVAASIVLLQWFWISSLGIPIFLHRCSDRVIVQTKECGCAAEEQNPCCDTIIQFHPVHFDALLGAFHLPNVQLLITSSPFVDRHSRTVSSNHRRPHRIIFSSSPPVPLLCLSTTQLLV